MLRTLTAAIAIAVTLKFSDFSITFLTSNAHTYCLHHYKKGARFISQPQSLYSQNYYQHGSKS